MEKTQDKQLIMLGCTHHKTSLEIREQFAISSENENVLYETLKSLPELSELLILNTCNRVEIYLVTKAHFDLKKILKIFCKTCSISLKTFNSNSFWLEEQEVLEHLFQVASGVDSQIVGETEIFGQVKEAYRVATLNQTTGPVLNRIFQKCFQAAKWARTNTGIGKGQISIGNIATELASRIFGNLKSTPTLIIGRGEVAEKTLQSLKSQGAKNITLSNRTFEKAQELSEKYGTTTLHYELLYQALHQFDVIISSTSANKVILDVDIVKKTMEKRSNTPLFFIDLAVPRNISNKIVNISNTYLYNLDDLAAIANKNLQTRQTEMDKCYTYLKHKASQVWSKI